MPDNPYEAGHDFNSDQLAPPPTSDDRPVSVKIFGILNIVFGLLGICGTLSSGAMLFGNFIPQDPNVPNPAFDAMTNSPGYRVFLMISMGLAFLFTICLLVGGIGLLQYRRYGRTASIAYGWWAIVSAIVGAVANYFFVWGPMMQQMQQQPGQGPMPAAMSPAVMIVIGVASTCVGMIYPVLLLFFMYRRNVVNSLT